MPPVAVAWILQLVAGAADAVKRPAGEMEPQEADQLTGMLAVNCWVPFCGVLAEAGVMTRGELMVATAEAVCAPLLARMVQDPGASGAV